MRFGDPSCCCRYVVREEPRVSLSVEQAEAVGEIGGRRCSRRVGRRKREVRCLRLWVLEYLSDNLAAVSTGTRTTGIREDGVRVPRGVRAKQLWI